MGSVQELNKKIARRDKFALFIFTKIQFFVAYNLP